MSNGGFNCQSEMALSAIDILLCKMEFFKSMKCLVSVQGGKIFVKQQLVVFMWSILPDDILILIPTLLGSVREVGKFITVELFRRTPK